MPSNLLDATLPDFGDQTSLFGNRKPGTSALTASLSSLEDEDPLRELSRLLGKSMGPEDATKFDFDATKFDLSDASDLLREGGTFLADNTMFTMANMSRYSPSKKPKLSTMPEEEDFSLEEHSGDFTRLLPIPTKKSSREVAGGTPTATHSLTGLLSKLTAQDGDFDMLMNEASPIGSKSLFLAGSPKRQIPAIPSPAQPSPRLLFAKMKSNQVEKGNYASAITESENRIRSLLARSPSKTASATPLRVRTPSRAAAARPPSIYKESTSPTKRVPSPVKRVASPIKRSASPTKLDLFQTPSKQLSAAAANIERSQQRSAIRSQTYSNFTDLLTGPAVKKAAAPVSIARSRTLTSLATQAEKTPQPIRRTALPSSRSTASLGALKAPSASQPNLARLARPSTGPAARPPTVRKASLQEMAAEPQKPLGSRYGFVSGQPKQVKPRPSQLPSVSGTGSLKMPSSRTSTRAGGEIKRRPA